MTGWGWLLKMSDYEIFQFIASLIKAIAMAFSFDITLS